MSEYTDTQRMAFLRHMIVADGFLPKEIARVRDDARATESEFNAAMDVAMKRCGWVPIDDAAIPPGKLINGQWEGVPLSQFPELQEEVRKGLADGTLHVEGGAGIQGDAE